MSLAELERLIFSGRFLPHQGETSQALPDATGMRRSAVAYGHGGGVVHVARRRAQDRQSGGRARVRQAGHWATCTSTASAIGWGSSTRARRWDRDDAAPHPAARHWSSGARCLAEGQIGVSTSPVCGGRMRRSVISVSNGVRVLGCAQPDCRMRGRHVDADAGLSNPSNDTRLAVVRPTPGNVHNASTVSGRDRRTSHPVRPAVA